MGKTLTVPKRSDMSLSYGTNFILQAGFWD